MNTLNTNIKRRYNYWLFAEKIAACILLLWSVFVLASIISVVSGMLHSGYIAAGNTSLSSIAIKNHLVIIVSVLCIVGSWLLLFKSKTGWIICIVSALIYCINLFTSSRSKAINSKLPFAEHYKSYGIAALLFLIILFLLLLKPIREKYQPTLKTWMLIIGIIVLCIVDKIIF